MRIQNLLASLSALLLLLASATAFAYTPTASPCGGDDVKVASGEQCGGDEKVASGEKCGDDVADQGRCGGDDK